MNESIAIIPARGGSKGVPRKNVLPLAGKPLIGWTIEAALNTRSVSKVVVSTEDAEIAQVSQECGAEVVWRPADLSGDLASSELALLHALDELEKQSGTLPPLTVFLQCTAPLMVSEDVQGTIDSLRNNDSDTAVAVADFHYFLWKSDAAGGFVGINHEKSVREMRQEREDQFVETGSVYVMKTDGFRAQKHRFFGKTSHYLMPSERVIEIDDPVDFKIADVLLRERLASQRAQQLPDQIDLIVLDFDGVLTDDRVTLSQDGTESVTCSRRDGMGISLARRAGLSMMILSSETNEVVRRRAEKLNLEIIHGVEDKQTVLDRMLSERAIPWKNVVFVGNDVNDAECLARCGCGVAVADATVPALEAANMVLTRKGGDHAVRELIDLVLSRDSLVLN